MARTLLVTALLLTAAAAAHAQSKVLVLIGHVVDNEFYFGHNADDPAILSQRVIPSKKGLRGVSFEESIIKPDSSVNNQTPIKAFVTTAGYPDDSPIDVGPVENIQLDGGQVIDEDGQNDDVAHAVRVSTQHARVRNSKIVNWKGTGVQLAQPIAAGGLASRRVENSVIAECHIGVSAVSDAMLFNNDIVGCRDYGVFSGDGTSGNVLISGCHIYDCNGLAGSIYDGIAIFLDEGSGWRIVGTTIADSRFGFVSGGTFSNTNTISGCTFFKNSKCAIQINQFATNYRIDGCTINVPPGTSHEQFNDIKGIELAGLRNLVSDSVIWLDGNIGNQVGSLPVTPLAGGGTAVRVTGDANQLDEVLILDHAYPSGKARGIHIPSAIEGFKADVKIWGFDQTGDVFLDIDTAAVKGLDITVRGNHTEIGENFPSDVNDTTVAQYVEIPAGWDSTNSIRFVNEANGDTHTLTTGQAY